MGDYQISLANPIAEKNNFYMLNVRCFGNSCSCRFQYLIHWDTHLTWIFKKTSELLRSYGVVATNLYAGSIPLPPHLTFFEGIRDGLLPGTNAIDLKCYMATATGRETTVLTPNVTDNLTKELAFACLWMDNTELNQLRRKRRISNKFRRKCLEKMISEFYDVHLYSWDYFGEELCPLNTERCNKLIMENLEQMLPRLIQQTPKRLEYNQCSLQKTENHNSILTQIAKRKGGDQRYLQKVRAEKKKVRDVKYRETRKAEWNFASDMQLSFDDEPSSDPEPPDTNLLNVFIHCVGGAFQGCNMHYRLHWNTHFTWVYKKVNLLLRSYGVVATKMQMRAGSIPLPQQLTFFEGIREDLLPCTNVIHLQCYIATTTERETTVLTLHETDQLIKELAFASQFIDHVELHRLRKNRCNEDKYRRHFLYKMVREHHCFVEYRWQDERYELWLSEADRWSVLVKDSLDQGLLRLTQTASLCLRINFNVVILYLYHFATL